MVGRGAAIPVPTPRIIKDSDPVGYTPKGMTAEQRTALKTAGVKMSNFLASLPKLPGTLDVASEAAANMRHYRNGGGRARSYDTATTEGILAQGDVQTATPMALDDVTSVFISQVVSTVAASGPGTYQFLAINLASNNSAIRETNWFPMYSIDTKWKFALGGFDFAPAALAINDGAFITVRYRIFIYDRYNWDEGKTVQIPLADPDLLLGAETMEGIYGIRPRQGTPNPYITKDREFVKNTAGEWVQGRQVMILNDALFGNLINEELAGNFDINGAGQVHVYRIAVSNAGNPAAVSNAINAETADTLKAEE